MNKEFEFGVLQEVVKNLWRLNKYLNIYINLLHGFMTDDEFEKEANILIKDSNDLTDEQIVNAVMYIRKLLPDAELEDMADLLNVDCEKIEKLLNTLEVIK